MDRQTERVLEKFFISFFALLGAATLAVVGVYVYTFRAAGVSRDPQDWGVLGDYLGGTLGTFFSLLAFVAALLTVALQRRQLDQVREQANRDELHRAIAYAGERLDELLHERPRFMPADLRQRMVKSQKEMSLYSLLAAAAHEKIFPGELPEGFAPIIEGPVMEVLRSDVPMVLIWLQHLVRSLEMYRYRRGSEDVESLYRERYRMSVAWIFSIGLLSAPIVERYFEPQTQLKQIAEFSGVGV
jgi:hypothetical protein